MNPEIDKSPPSSQRAAGALRDLIFSGELPAGSDHLESELAVRLGMSRTPVREAVLVLEGQGLLEVRPRKGVRILPVSPEDMREVYDVLTVLESMAAEQAAAAGYGNADLANLSEAIEQMDRAIEHEDLPAWAAADDRFHTELVRLGGNSRVMEIVERMSDQVRRARSVTLYVRPMPTQSNEDHRAVLEAIRSGNVQEAGDRHHQHRLNAKKVLIGLLTKMGLNSI